MEEQRQIRRRVNASKSTKGIVTWDVTVEIIQPLSDNVTEGNDYTLIIHDDLVAKLESRYPTKEE